MSATRPEQLYESDFYAWTQAQAEELRRFAKTRPNLPLDLAHIAEELRDLGKSERDAVFGLAQQIIQHFLMIEHSPAVTHRRHRMDEVDAFRMGIKRKLSPTIRRQLRRALEEEYREARRLVQRKMDRHGEHAAVASLPENCPYSLEQILGDWEPDASRGPQ
jgi:hypothetical protein